MGKGFCEVMKTVHVSVNKYVASYLGISYLNLWLCKTPEKNVVQDTA